VCTNRQTDRETDRQTDRQTNADDHNISPMLLVEVTRNEQLSTINIQMY